MTNRANADAAQRNADCRTNEVLEQLRIHGTEAAALVRNLHDEDLGRSAPFVLFGGEPTTVRAFIERVLIGDPVAHLASLRIEGPKSAA